MSEHLVEYSDDTLKRMIRILGEGSAAWDAQTERDRRRASGEDAVIYWDRRRAMLLVGPRLPTPPTEPVE